MLAIEIDGMSHNHEEAFNKDELRQQKLEGFGVQFLRFTEAEVKQDIFNVIKTIEITVITLVKNNSSIKLPMGFDQSLLD